MESERIIKYTGADLKIWEVGIRPKIFIHRWAHRQALLYPGPKYLLLSFYYRYTIECMLYARVWVRLGHCVHSASSRIALRRRWKENRKRTRDGFSHTISAKCFMRRWKTIWHIIFHIEQNCLLHFACVCVVCALAILVVAVVIRTSFECRASVAMSEWICFVHPVGNRWNAICFHARSVTNFTMMVNIIRYLSQILARIHTTTPPAPFLFICRQSQ